MSYSDQLKEMNSKELDKEWEKVMKETADLIEADDDENTKKILEELKQKKHLKEIRPMFDADGEKIKYGGTRRRRKKRKHKTKSRRQKKKRSRSGGMLHSMVGPGELKYITSSKSEPRRNTELEMGSISSSREGPSVSGISITAFPGSSKKKKKPSSSSETKKNAGGRKKKRRKTYRRRRRSRRR